MSFRYSGFGFQLEPSIMSDAYAVLPHRKKTLFLANFFRIRRDSSIYADQKRTRMIPSQITPLRSYLSPFNGTTTMSAYRLLHTLQAKASRKLQSVSDLTSDDNHTRRFKSTKLCVVVRSYGGPPELIRVSQNIVPHGSCRWILTRCYLEVEQCDTCKISGLCNNIRRHHSRSEGHGHRTSTTS